MKDIMPSVEILKLAWTNVTQQEFPQFALRFPIIFAAKEGRKGGGVLMLARKSQIADQISVSLIKADVISVSIIQDSAYFLLMALYRSPNNNARVFLGELSCYLKRHPNKQIIRAGDVYIDLQIPMKSMVREYLTLIDSFGLENHIRGYTREEYLGNKLTQSCIDHIQLKAI